MKSFTDLRNLMLAAFLFALVCSAASSPSRPLIFPKPQEMQLLEGRFSLDAQVSILLPAAASKADLHLAGFLANELSDRYDLQLKANRAVQLPDSGPVILMGSIANPLVKEYCALHKIEVTPKNPGPEGYVLHADGNTILIAGSDDAGAFYGLQSLRQLIHRRGEGLEIQRVRVRDWPDKPFRGFKLYLPGRANIPFFKRFVRDVLALYKCNKLMMEMNASMRLDKHPELNAGWLEFARDANYSRRNYPPGPPHELEQNSSHQDTADGGFLEREEVADLARWAESNFIEVIPEIPSLTHSYYLLSKHKDLAEVPGEKWPDTFCPLNPKSYDLLFDVFDEYIEVMKPKMIHIGHDEWFVPMDQCPRCRGKDYRVLYANDVRKTHDYLAKKGIRIAMWGDMLLQSVRGTEPRWRKTPTGWKYRSPCGLTPEQVRDMIPKDILIFNWFWSGKNAEEKERQLDEMGFHQIYGNFESQIRDYEKRSDQRTLIGGAPSSWAATTEFNISKDLLLDMLGCENMLWSKQHLDARTLMDTVQSMMPEIRESVRGTPPPSETEAQMEPIDISASFNIPAQNPSMGFDLGGMQNGRLTAGRDVFDFAAAQAGRFAAVVGTEGKEKNPLPRSITGIPIGQDPTSLIFLQASAKPAANKEAYRNIWDFDDTADLLGWYEVVYEDGFVETIPIRYGVNILEWNWGQRQTGKVYAYDADAVDCSKKQDNSVTFFAFEWKNPRLGKVIREVRLRGTAGFRGGYPGFENAYGPVIPNNAVILKAISYVKKR